MIVALRWLLPLLMLTNLVASQQPVIDKLYGCTRINSTALDQCNPGDTFYVVGQNFTQGIVPQVMLSTDGASPSISTCSYYSTEAISCVVPNVNTGVWFTVTIVRDGSSWSNQVSPGLRVAVPPPSPIIDSVYASCGAAGCVNGELLRVSGTNLLSNNTNANVYLSQYWYKSSTFECPIIFAWSTSTTLYCYLPVVPNAYRGINLEVKVVNAWGSCIITGGVTYAAPSSSSSSSSSAGGWQPLPPDPSGGSSSSSSSVSVAAYLPSIVFAFVIFLIVIIVIRRRRVSRRRMLLAMSANPAAPAPPAYVTIQNQPIYAPQQHVQPSYYPSQSAHPPMQQQAQSSVHSQQQPNVPLMSIQYQPAYYQYPAGSYQPSAPSAYPHVHAYQGM